MKALLFALLALAVFDADAQLVVKQHAKEEGEEEKVVKRCAVGWTHVQGFGCYLYLIDEVKSKEKP